MTPEEFARQVRNSVIDENLLIYKDLFSSTDEQAASDHYWKRALRLYAKLDSSDQGVLFEMIRQVMVDTISNVFAVLDGVSQLDGFTGEFNLLTNTSTEKLNGELQTRFLQLEESK